MALNAGTVQSFATLNDKGFVTGMSNLKKQGERFSKEMQKNFARIGKSLTAKLTLPLGIAGIAAGKLAMDFETSLSKIEGLVGIAGSEVQKMRKDVLALSGSTARAPQELADALFFVTSAGLRGADAIDVLEKSAKASAAGLGETKNIADLLTSAINAYGKQNITSAQATDILTAAVREGKLEAESLAPAIGKLLPMATELGISFDQVAGFLAAMSRTGLDANRSSTALRGIMMKLIKPTEMAKDQLAEYGLSAEDLRNQVKGGGLLSVLRTLSTTFAGNEEAMSRVFEDVEGLVGVLNILGQDADTVSGIMDGVTNSTGAMEEAFDVASKTAQFKFNKALSAIKASAIEMGAIMLPIVAKIAESIASLSQRFSEFSRLTKTVALFIAGIAFAAGPTLLALSSMIKAYRILAPLLPIVATKMKALTAVMIANPYIAVGAAIATIGSMAWLASSRMKALREESERLLDLDIDSLSIEMLDRQIDSLAKKIQQIDQSSFTLFGYDFEAKRLQELQLELSELISKRNELKDSQIPEIINTDNISRAKQLMQQFLFLTQSFKLDPNVFKSWSDRALETAQNIRSIKEAMSAPVDQIFDPSVVTQPFQDINQIVSDTESRSGDFAHRLTVQAQEGGQAIMGLANSIGNMFSQAVLHGSKLGDVVKNLLKQLASKAFIVGIGALLTGGASLGGGSFLSALFGGMFHGGGIVGGSGDKMIRAKGGEMVLTKSQQRALSMGGSQQSFSPQNMSVKVHVMGKIQGEDIYISGQRAQISWNR